MTKKTKPTLLRKATTKCKAKTKTTVFKKKKKLFIIILLQRYIAIESQITIGDKFDNSMSPHPAADII